MGCGTSRPREMQVIHHAPWSWYGGRVAPDLEPDESFHQNCHSTNWWFSDQLDLDESYQSHPVTVPQRDNSAELPPYTEVAQNGHVSLMHGSPVNYGHATHNNSAQNTTDTNVMDSSTLTANNISVHEASQCSTEGQDQSGAINEDSLRDSSENTLSCQSPFHPTRQSTPVQDRRGVMQLPPIQRSRSALDAPTSIQTASSDVDNLQQRHSINGVPLALPSSLPPRLRPVLPMFSQTVDESVQSSELSNSEENVGPFPVRPGRLPPLQQENKNMDQQRRLSCSFQGQNQVQRRKKKKRRRTHSWHGERLGTEIIPTIQEVSTLSTVNTLSTVAE